MSHASTTVKRLFDVTMAASGLVMLSPMLAAIAIAIKLGSPGPILYRQQRVGVGFKPFMIYKFRTMVPNAASGGPITWGGDHDRRITGVGRLLRRTKLDEIPQLINVLKGEMSLVGPRPEVPHYVELFRAEYTEILTARPGITDFASLAYRDEAAILGRSAEPAELYVRDILPAKIRLSRDYVRCASLAVDLKVICRTLLKVVRPGA